MANTILWHDYETSGLDPRSARPLQFAAVRTTEDLREVGEPLQLRCRLASDVLPDPEACLVTRVVPGDHADDERSELTFARTIAAAIAAPDTCAAGYNSIRFDDEFTRFLLWRCLLPVYDREWQNGNSRWDLMDPLRAAFALRPDGISWPRHEDGQPSFRLGDLARANAIPHDAAHDALADVRITIALARRLRSSQPRLYGFLFAQRTRQATQSRLRDGLATGQTLVHTSGRFAGSHACTSIVVPIAVLEDKPNQVVCIDLRHDPEILLDGDPDQLRTLLYTRRADLPPDAPRIGIKSVHANRAPVLAPMAVLDDACWQRIQLEPAVIEMRRQWVAAHRERLAPLAEFLSAYEGTGDPDPEAALYDGFPPPRDEPICRDVHRTAPAGWRQLEERLSDHRLRELLFRLRCREAPETMDEGDRRRWQDHLQLRLYTPLNAVVSRLDAVRQEIEGLRQHHATSRDALQILDRVAIQVEQRAAAAAP